MPIYLCHGACVTKNFDCLLIKLEWAYSLQSAAISDMAMFETTPKQISVRRFGLIRLFRCSLDPGILNLFFGEILIEMILEGPTRYF